MTTFLPAAATSFGWLTRPPTAKAAAMSRVTLSRSDRWPDALWAPLLGTGKTLASSLPEHRAWGTATVVVPPAAEGRARRGADCETVHRTADWGSVARSDRERSGAVGCWDTRL